MKLVEGQTLAERLANQDSAGQDSQDLLQVFWQVCNIMSYAHARGIVHRDLKPANVMIGAMGEVQVMDWGLAKVLVRSDMEIEQGEPATTDEGIAGSWTEGLDTVCGSDLGTQLGTVLGTPAYMPPEQARGEVETLDERCDVFGLGAILCAILTGQPPFVGQDAHEAAHQAAAADLADAFARLDGCGAEDALVLLAKRCLASDPDNRRLRS
jgi:serine/threonine-protein kinase